MQIALSEVVNDVVSEDAISLNEEFQLSFYHEFEDAEELPESPIQHVEAARLYIDLINASFSEQYQSGSSPIEFLFPSDLHLISDEISGNQGYTVTYGFSLHFNETENKNIKDKFISIYLNSYGNLIGLISNWCPITQRQNAPALKLESLNSRAFYGDQEDDSEFISPDFYVYYPELDSYLPSINYFDGNTNATPTVQVDGLHSDPAYLDPLFEINDDLVRSLDEMPYRTLAHLRSLDLSPEFIASSVNRMTGLHLCFEALDVANQLHLSNNNFDKDTWHTYDNFRFKLKLSENIQKGISVGVAQIEMEHYSMQLKVELEIDSSYKHCLNFKDKRFPHESFKSGSCNQKKTSLNPYQTEEIMGHLGHVESWPAIYTDANYLSETNDFFVLQKTDNDNLVIIAYDCRGKSSQDISALKDAAAITFGEEDLIIDASQLNDFVVEEGFPTVDPETTFRLGLSSATVHSTETYTQLSAENLYSNRNQSKLVGEAGEKSYRARNLWFDQDLNDVPWVNRRGQLRTDNHPIWDTQGSIFGSEGLIQIKTSRATIAKRRYSTYDGGLLDIMGGLKNNRRRTLFELIALQDFQNSGLTNTEILVEAKRQGLLAINDSDLGGYKEHVDAKLRRDLGKYTTYFDALLTSEPLVVDGTSFNSVAEIEAHPNAAVKDSAYNAIIERVKGKIVGNGTSTSGNQRLNSFQRDVLHNFSKSQIDTMMQVTPEAGMIAHMGRTKAAMHSGAKSGVSGMVWGAGFALVHDGIFADEVDFGRIATSAVASGVGEGFGTAASTSVVPYSQLITRYGVRGAIGGRVAGGGIVGAISAPVVEFSTMVYDEYTGKANYENYDYTSRVGTEAVGGVVVGASAGLATAVVSAATVGTAAGTVVPVVGNVAGFVAGVVVGLVAYAVYSHFAKETVSESIRIGHLRALEKLHTLKGNWQVHDFGYFQVVASRLPGGDDYNVIPTNEHISIMNPVDGTSNEFIKVKAEGRLAKQLFEPKIYDYVDKRIVFPNNAPRIKTTPQSANLDFFTTY